jgi:hydrogenase nickel incorporation protein HypB
MCSTCGCGDEDGTRLIDLQEHGHHSGPHEHTHEHSHADHSPDVTRTVTLEEAVLAKNNLRAERNRGWLQGREVVAINLMSSPGSGKTTLLEQTIHALCDVRIAVIEGDQETTFDAERIKATGVHVVQINTGAGCHLDADMVDRGLRAVDPPVGSLLFIENVGNLVCPALFDLGEAARVVIMSVTEGAGKPLKYPHMFRSADAVVLNKVDLLPYVDFDPAEFHRHLRRVNPRAELFSLSATRGDGIDLWFAWLRSHMGARAATVSR